MNGTEILRIHHNSAGMGTEPENRALIIMPETVKSQVSVPLTVELCLHRKMVFPYFEAEPSGEEITDGIELGDIIGQPILRRLCIITLYGQIQCPAPVETVIDAGLPQAPINVDHINNGDNFLFFTAESAFGIEHNRKEVAWYIKKGNFRQNRDNTECCKHIGSRKKESAGTVKPVVQRE